MHQVEIVADVEPLKEPFDMRRNLALQRHEPLESKDRVVKIASTGSIGRPTIIIELGKQERGDHISATEKPLDRSRVVSTRPLLWSLQMRPTRLP